MDFGTVALTIGTALCIIATLAIGLGLLCRWMGERELGGPGAVVNAEAVERMRAKLHANRHRLLKEPEADWQRRGDRLAAEAEAFLADTARR